MRYWKRDKEKWQRPFGSLQDSEFNWTFQPSNKFVYTLSNSSTWKLSTIDAFEVSCMSQKLMPFHRKNNNWKWCYFWKFLLKPKLCMDLRYSSLKYPILYGNSYQQSPIFTAWRPSRGGRGELAYICTGQPLMRSSSKQATDQ